MFINNRAETIIPGKMDNRVIDASKELAELGSIKEDLKAEIKASEQKALAYKDIDEKVGEAEVELARLKPLVADYSKKLTELKAVNEELVLVKKELKEANALTQGILKGNSELWETRKKIETKISEEQANLDSAVLANQEKLEAAKKEFTVLEKSASKKVDEYNAKLEGIESDIELAVKTAKELHESNVGLQSKIIKAEETIESLEEKKVNVEKQSLELIANADDYSFKVKLAADEYATAKNLELDARDGELSDKESWLTEKETILRETKVELEKFYGRKINNVII